MLAIREIERVESRALAALRFVDAATGFTLATPLRVSTPPGTQLLRNRSGLYVIRRSTQLRDHEDAFVAPPPLPAVESVSLAIEVRDPAGVYLPRTVRLGLPRDPRPENAHAPNSVFRAVDVELYRSPAAATGPNWAALRLTLTESGTGDALGGALIRVVSNGDVLARGLSDHRGEALVAVVGVPITTWSEDANAVIASEIEATVQIFFDRAAGSVRTPQVELAATNAPPPLPIPDPQVIESNPAALVRTLQVRIAAGRLLVLGVTVELPG